MTESINVTQAANLIKSDEAILIDVREPDEFKDSHIACAISVPLSVLERGFQMLDIPSDKTLIFQCMKGSRGSMACARMQHLGIDNKKIRNIEGGIAAWKAEGLPVIEISQEQPKVSLTRQVHIILGFLVALCVCIGFSGLLPAFVLAGFLGAALCFSGFTGWCGLAVILAKMPWNK